MGPPTYQSQHLFVDNLMCPTTKSWIKERVSILLRDSEQETLLLRPSKVRVKDKFIWLLKKNGDYAAKSGYQVAMMAKEIPGLGGDLESFNWFKEIWNIKCGHKINFFLWKAMVRALPMNELLRTRGINSASLRPYC